MTERLKLYRGYLKAKSSTPDVGHAARTIASGWRLNTVMEYSSGRRYAGLLGTACTTALNNNLTTPSNIVNLTQTLSCGILLNNTLVGNSNLNDTAFLQDTANAAGGISQAGPTPGIGLNSFYGPWLERIDLGLGRSFKIADGKELEFQARF